MLKLTTKQRYAARIMVFLAGADHGDRPSRKKEIALAEDIPADYVEQICMKLKTGGLIRSHRGKQGGFSLACDPGRITVADVMEAVEGPTPLAPCLDDKCRRSSGCAMRPVWQQANDALQKVLRSVTVGQLAQNAKKMESARAISFEI